MKLGLNWLPLRTEEEVEAALPMIDELGLAAICAPDEMKDWTLEQCTAYGEMVRRHGLTIGECGYWDNLLTRDEALRGRRIKDVRELLIRADAMRCRCIVTLVGSFDSAGTLSPHPDNWSDDARSVARENCLRILDGLDLHHTCYVLEPWNNTFFHKPEDIRRFLDSVDSPRCALHLDIMNMHWFDSYFDSTRLIETAFDLLADRVVSVHAKDLKWSNHMFVRLDEVIPGEGVLDYPLFLRKLSGLPVDTPVFTEHWQSPADYVETMRRLRAWAAEEKLAFATRNQTCAGAFSASILV